LADLKRRIVVADRVAEALRSKGLNFHDLHDAFPVMLAKNTKVGGQDTIRKMMSNVGEIAVALYVAEHKEKLRVPSEE